MNGCVGLVGAPTCVEPPVLGPLCIAPVQACATQPICAWRQGRCVAGVLQMGYYDGPTAAAALIGSADAYIVVECPKWVFTAVPPNADPVDDREVVTLCNAAGEPIVVQYNVSVVPPAELSRWNLATGAAEPAGALQKCGAADGIELVNVTGCLNGQSVNGLQSVIDINTATPSILGALWQDPITGTWGAAPAGMVFGPCADICSPTAPVGVVPSWGV